MKSRKSIRACVLALVSMGCALGVGADTFVWAGGSNGRWNDPLSYEGGVENGPVPGATDEIWIPKDTTINIDVTDVGSFAVFANVYCIHPTNNTSVLVFDIPSGVTGVVNSAINYTGWKGGNIGYVVKKGAGALELTSCTRYNNNGNINYRDNYVNYIIEQGDLILPQNTTTKHNGYYGDVAISNGATVFLETTSPSENLEVHTYMQSLDGDGDVRDLYAGTASHTLRVQMSGTFAGRLTENVRWYGSGNINLTGTNSTMTGAFQHYYNGNGKNYSGVEGENAIQGIIGIKKFGKKGEASSIGSNEQIGTRDHGAVIRYLGEGETTDKTLLVSDTARAPVVLDAGAVGGLAWTGIWQQNTGKTANRSNHRLVLTGSNTVPCVFSGQLNSATFTNPETVRTNYDFYVSKYGSGTWRFADSTDNAANRTFAGGIAVHEGVLQFDSINEKGVPSALGTSTNLHADLTGPGTLPQVDYAYVLGGGANVATAVFEHVGWDLPPTAANAATNRPIALNGRGTIRANGSYLGLGGIRGMSAGNHTLVLDGTTTVNNVASDISDGPSGSTVSVEKTGSGTWAIGRDLSFSGALDVKEGELRVRPADRYTWYRWTIKANHSTVTNGNETLVVAQELALFDEDGMRQNIGLAMNSNITTLAAGQIGLDTEYNYTTKNSIPSGSTEMNWRQLDKLCDDATTDPGWMIQSYGSKTATSGSYYVRVNNPNSWLPVVLRLAPGSAPVTSWNWVYSVNKSGSIFPRVPSIYTLEGSVDGLHWDMLSNHDTFEDLPEMASGTWVFNSNYIWRFGNKDKYTAGSTASTARKDGEAIASAPADAATYSTLGNIASISVAAGARLVSDGDPIVLPPGITVNLDASSGGGTLSGFKLPSSGTLNLENWPKQATGAVTIPFDMSASDYASATNWTVTVGGEHAVKSATFSAAGVEVRGPGTVVLIR